MDRKGWPATQELLVLLELPVSVDQLVHPVLGDQPDQLDLSDPPDWLERMATQERAGNAEQMDNLGNRVHVEYQEKGDQREDQ